MAGNPQVPQGILNRIKGSVIIPGFPALNITAPYLGREGIRISFSGVTTEHYETMTGAVLSPQPYQITTVRVNLLKTQSLALAFETQRKLLSILGDLTVTSDATPLPMYPLANCSIENVDTLTFSGQDPNYIVDLKGQYYINSSLFDVSPT